MNASCALIHAIPFVPGQAEGRLSFGPGEIESDSIVVLRWWEIKQLARRPAAVIIVGYAPLAHPMIRLFGFGLPTVVVNEQQAAGLVPGQRLMIDGDKGLIASAGKLKVDPVASSVLKPDEVLHTADGQTVVLRTSVGSLESAKRAKQFGASGIGLLRSERFNPADGSQPDADFYHRTFDELCRTVAPMSVTIRLLDIVQDKRPPWLDEISGMQGPLGLKGARLYDTEPVRSVLHAELEAINALAKQYPLSLLLPYIGQPEEFLHWREMISRRLSLDIPIGTMIETPAVALALPEFLQMADFVAIGCNDLMQCLFAADRDVVEVGHLLDPYSPFLFRFMQHLAESISEADMSRVQLCGLLSQFPGVMPIMLGLGYRYFSVEPYLIPYLVQTIRNTTITDTQKLADDVCRAHDAGTVRQRLDLAEWNMQEDYEGAG